MKSSLLESSVELFHLHFQSTFTYDIMMKDFKKSILLCKFDSINPYGKSEMDPV